MSALLDRATPAYAQGYRDFRDGRPKLYENNGTFQGYDYHHGWEAAWNDMYWSAVRENENKSK